MTKIISVKVSKGGVGKTTICINLADLLSKNNKKTLLIDLDPQSNLSTCFIKNIDTKKLTSSNLIGDETVEEIDRFTYKINGNLDIISSDNGLNLAARHLEKQDNYFYKLKNIFLQKDFSKYDYIIIDLSPGVSDTLTEVSFTASDLIICPTHFDIDSLSGIILTIEDLSRLKEANIIDNKLDYLIVPNRYDQRFKKDNKMIFDMLYGNIDKEMISQPIRENSHIKKARMRGISAIEYEADIKRKYEHKKATQDFKELMIKIEKTIDTQN